MNVTGKTLTYGAQKDLERRIDDLKDALGGKEVVQGVNVTSPNIALAKKRINQLEGLLSSQGVGKISDKEREDAEKECKLLETDLRKGMPTWDQYVGSRPKDGPRHDKMVDWITQTNADPLRQQKIQRWKSLRRHLYPENPKASHVMYLFPE
jgi:hypothetical protein